MLPTWLLVMGFQAGKIESEGMNLVLLKNVGIGVALGAVCGGPLGSAP